MLQRCCNAPSLLFVTQSNTPISSTVHYEQEPVKNVPIESSIYYMLPKSMPYQRQQLARCAVVGNGGILHNSRCGSEIDAMEFVFRCNLPPVSAEFAKDVGSKTDIVTINPSIIIDRYDSLMQRHGPFLARIRSYGNASLLLPAFFGGRSMELALRARYVLDEAGSSRPLYFFHPIYLAHVGAFWRRHGVQERRSSSGLLVASAALELCREVHLYGFWPFSQDVDGAHLSHHYYDDQRPRPGIHVMPIENFHFLQLHSKGILRVHTQRCSN
uniref:ST8 alpha-N-acetyl-neuraminide alpha-2,8-sialyltransferase 5 n=1 Tax=Eptatretus burgeri TaxID=7764 RepID=A0A8C4QRA9_EPTBU